MKSITNWNALPVVLPIDLAAQVSGYHPAYLRELARNGEFPASQNKPKGKWRIEKDRLREWITEQGEQAS